MVIMTGKDLQAFGERLYGAAWRPELAYELGVDVGTLRRYVRLDAVPRVVELATAGIQAKLAMHAGATTHV